MTDEQAVRKLLAEEFRYGPNTHVGQLAAQALALLDAKDAELREYKEALAFTESERDEALSRAEQAEAALAEERKAHQAFREEVSEAVENAETVGDLFHFILPAKPADPLRKLAVEMVLADGVIRTGNQEQAIRDGRAAQEAVAEHERRLRAAIERAGVTISFEGEG